MRLEHYESTSNDTNGLSINPFIFNNLTRIKPEILTQDGYLCPIKKSDLQATSNQILVTK